MLGEKVSGDTSGTSSGWSRGPRHTFGSGDGVISANLTSRPRRNDVVRRGGLRRLADAGGCKLADEVWVINRGGGCTDRPNGECRRNCRATTGCQYDVPAKLYCIIINKTNTSYQVLPYVKRI